MSKITNKQITIISDVDFNNKKIVNAQVEGYVAFPTIITNSGNTLPSAASYQVNDTFLNTTDKKIYTLNSFSEYSLNTSQFATLGIYGNIFNTTTGNFSNFDIEYNGSLYVTPNDTTNFVLTIPFQVNNLGNTMGIVQFNYQGPTDLFNVRISSTGSVEIKDGNNYLEVYSSIQANEKYILKVEVSGEEESSLRNVSVKLYDENGTMLGNEATSSYDSNSVSITMGVFHQYGPNYNYFIGTIFGFLGTQSLNISNINLVAKEYTWDNGTALIDKTEYVDKTNKILYIYKDTELIDIGGQN